MYTQVGLRTFTKVIFCDNCVAIPGFSKAEKSWPVGQIRDVSEKEFRERIRKDWARENKEAISYTKGHSIEQSNDASFTRL